MKPNRTARQAPTWDHIVTTFARTGGATTQRRKLIEFSNKRWAKLRVLPVDQTAGIDFLDVLARGGVSTSMALRGVESLALETGLLTHPVLPRKLWPKYTPRPKRAITEKEHRLLWSNSLKRSWRCFLEILWETGASQSDAASLRIEKLTGGVVTYRRCKTGVRAAQQVSPQLAGTLASLAGGRTKGFFIPQVQRMLTKDRSHQFRRQCTRLDIDGVTLHSYRYAWAERAFQLGLPERFAMVALGHNSPAVHRAYCKNAKVVCPSLVGFGAAGAGEGLADE
jgi:integrase